MRTATKRQHNVERLEARIDPELKRLFQRAADLRGITLSDFLIDSARAAALKAVEQQEVIRLTSRESHAFAAALLNPPIPNAALRRAARAYRARIRTA